MARVLGKQTHHDHGWVFGGSKLTTVGALAPAFGTRNSTPHTQGFSGSAMLHRHSKRLSIYLRAFSRMRSPKVQVARFFGMQTHHNSGCPGSRF